ncbi:MAG: thioredoxin family protein [Candidatus Obscuribacterales bacterium]
MRNQLVVCILISLVGAFSGTNCMGKPTGRPVGKISTSKPVLPWLQDISTAKAAAKLKHKLIVVDVFTDNCHWCKRLDQETFQNPGVISELSSRFVWLKLNARATTTDLKAFKIDGYPTILVLDDNGKLVTSFSGYLPPEQFVERMAMLLP